MIVESLNEKTLDEYYKALYLPTGAMEVPRHFNWYASLLYNTNSSNAMNLQDFQNYRIDTVLHTALVNKCLDRPIINYHYSPKNGFLKKTKDNIWMQYSKEDWFADDVVVNRMLYKNTIPTRLNLQSDVPGQIKAGNTLDTTTFMYSTQIQNNYYQRVEGYAYINPHKGQTGTFKNQPQVHLGILATPALNPGTEVSNFLNSAVYTVTNAECTIECDINNIREAYTYMYTFMDIFISNHVSTQRRRRRG